MNVDKISIKSRNKEDGIEKIPDTARPAERRSDGDNGYWIQDAGKQETDFNFKQYPDIKMLIP
jgi:hypothetical protein